MEATTQTASRRATLATGAEALGEGYAARSKAIFGVYVVFVSIGSNSNKKFFSK